MCRTQRTDKEDGKMSHMQGYMAGVNLGGWISQFHRDENALSHFETFITKEDIDTIAAIGMDHVRLPVDCCTLTAEYAECGLAYIDRCIAWCRDAGLNVVIDLHDAPGFRFDLEDNTLLDSAECQDQMAEIWRKLAARYRHEGGNVRYELLNEVKDDTPDRWNALAARLIREIRAIDPTHYIIVGGINMNNIRHVADIERFRDERIVYTFHMYDPFQFTHQRADFVPIFAFMDGHIPYPCRPEEHNAVARAMTEKIAAATGREPDFSRGMIHAPIDKDSMRKMFEPARKFIEETGLPVYCGEYGAHENCGDKSRARYVSDVSDLCLEYDIGRAMWSYKGMGFRMMDERLSVHEALTEAAARK